MRAQFLGDSYDIVKRFWSEKLKSIAPLYAHPRFVPAGIHGQYTLVTSIPIFGKRPRGRFAILLDPDTGIPLPHESARKATASHAPLSFVAAVYAELHPTYMICFDQSYHRRHELTRRAQRDAKRDCFLASGIHSFYYVSHAPFLFLAMEKGVLDTLRSRLVALGIPESLFEPHSVQDV